MIVEFNGQQYELAQDMAAMCKQVDTLMDTVSTGDLTNDEARGLMEAMVDDTEYSLDQLQVAYALCVKAVYGFDIFNQETVH